MKQIIITGFALVTIFSSCRITDKNQDRAITSDMINTDPENAPIMEFENETFEFKNIAVGSTINHSFKFKNTGKVALLLNDVRASCGCTVLKGWPKEPIAPGESGEIPIEFTPNVTGKNEKSVSIVANTIPSTKKLHIRGTVVGTD